jgi:hypothetical protein
VGDQDDSTKIAELESRPPTVDDLIKLCRALNDCGAKYIVIGGMAVIQQGFVRATEDIDLLLEASKENVERVKKAMMTLPDQAVREVDSSDLDRYVVVRVADEIVVDLMKRACGVEYAEASGQIERVNVRGVEIPFASAELLWKLKQTVRAKDELDRFFLAERLGKR